jgi:hypothetical protein
MSLAQLQHAVALLIRLPEHHRGDQIEGFLPKFDLDPGEQAMVRALAADPRVAKYGRSMAGVRGETLRRQLRRSARYLSPELMDELHRSLFEPEATLVQFGDLAPTFLDFVLSDARARRALLDAAPPFIFDVLRLERAEMRFRGELRPDRCPPLPGTRLVHSAFCLLALEHDILPSLTVRPGSEGEIPVERREVLVLLVAHPALPVCRMFEIDAATAAFLAAQARGEAFAAEPSTFADLVNLGLCRPPPREADQ